MNLKKTTCSIFPPEWRTPAAHGHVPLASTAAGVVPPGSPAPRPPHGYTTGRRDHNGHCYCDCRTRVVHDSESGEGGSPFPPMGGAMGGHPAMGGQQALWSQMMSSMLQSRR